MNDYDEDRLKVKIKGTWWDEIYETDPDTGELVLLEKTEPRSNLQMDASLLLLSGLLANDTGFFGGILYHAQGRGDSGWGATPPAPPTTDTTLYDEIDRNQPDSIQYLDGSDNPTLTRTLKLLISTTYGPTEFVGETIREQALFGGNATATIDSGVILNIIRHDPRFKSSGVTWIRRIKLELS